MEFDELRDLVIDRIDMSIEQDDNQLREIIDSVIRENCNVKYVTIGKRWDLHNKIFNSIRGFGAIQELLDDDEITEIMINGSNGIFIEKNGNIYQLKELSFSEDRLEDIIQQIVSGTNRRVNETNPIVDTRLSDGSRVNIVLPPISLCGPVITIRKFPKESIGVDELINWGTITLECASFLQQLVIAGYNIFVSGGTGTGKTTFLNVLSNYIPDDQRVITIEDSAELRLNNIKNLISLETRMKNSQGENEVTIRELIKTSLRMRPDRIIVGEIRGPEALDMLQAMNTGHDGSMSTGHANSSKDILFRIETMVLTGIDMPLAAIRAQISSAIDIIIHLKRFRDKSRKVVSVEEVIGVKQGEIKLNPLFKYSTSEGRLIRTNKEFINKSKLEEKGFLIEEQGS